MNTVATKLPHAARLLLGLIFFVFGLNGFLQFLPMPELPAPAGSFMGALAATGYFFPVLKATEVVGGLLLLSNRFVGLALVLLAPIVVQIALFHIVLTPGQIALSVVLLGLEAYLGFAYRDAFRGVLTAKLRPKAGEEAPARHRARAAA
ncbi:MAG TPA: DoxX family protein [Polyangiaceae bacterium LLY-WYZ-15_(1-7)]|nr:DoxX family protein [Myxococcales bacterium]MAT27958.1 DoxX family protein [Sandaracinus sp.]HJL06104.1 DoxX family protein [Polyangiaceae bacterium LLY-WYZ-15_(1-7)]MBJ71232.1 DoxX family protein [Sandaracinus sp.]HJL06970.1 DoxX family protein [Polyangiaceae bacterium LLY-WYZ-15_(1-7)]